MVDEKERDRGVGIVVDEKGAEGMGELGVKGKGRGVKVVEKEWRRRGKGQWKGWTYKVRLHSPQTGFDGRVQSSL